MLSEVAINISIPYGKAWFGHGYIAGNLPEGIVTINGTPAAREVELRVRHSREVVAAVMSADDGTYRFDWVSPSLEFDAIARDWRREWKDVIEPAITPEPY
jgi:hypothetical protein